MNKDMVVFQGDDGAIELRVDQTFDTVWSTQAQTAQVFGIDRTVATRHLNKILVDKEVDKKSNVQKMHFANSDKPVAVYSLITGIITLLICTDDKSKGDI